MKLISKHNDNMRGITRLILPTPAGATIYAAVMESAYICASEAQS